MSCPFNKESLAQLKTFINLCQTSPELLHLPDLAFFKDFIISLGGTVPAAPKMDSKTEVPPPQQHTPAESDEELPDIDMSSDAESDLELDIEGCIQPDVLSDVQKMGDPTKELTEEETDKADEIKHEALSELNEGNFEKAVELLTQAIEINPSMAILFTKRGQAYLKLVKPNACIKDCTYALELNCDSAPAYKYRGRAYRLIGQWEEAAKDLRQACKIDFDEQADEWLKEVQPNALKIEQHKLKQERKRQDKEQKDRAEKVRKAREAHAKAAAGEKDKPAAGGMPRMPGGMPGPGGMGMPDFMKLLQDPEMMAALKDPEVSAAFQDIMQNPENIEKYHSNPKISALLGKLAGMFGESAGVGGGMPGFPGGFAGGFPGMGGMGRGPGAPDGGAPPQDDGLD